MSLTTSDPRLDSMPSGLGISPEEWALRCDLAAAYQLVDLYGYSDLAGTHISVRVPGPEHHFLLNPLGVLFDQITASSLIKVDQHGQVVDGDNRDLNFAGFVIHSAIHMARPDLICALHTHTRANNGVGATAEGLLPLTQKALLILPFVSYHAYEGAATDIGERERIVEDLGEHGRVMILRNHGALTVGASIAEAWVWNYRLEQACRFQVDAMACVAGGLTPNHLDQATIDHTMAQGKEMLSSKGWFAAGTTEWPSLLRKLENERGTAYRT